MATSRLAPLGKGNTRMFRDYEMLRLRHAERVRDFERRAELRRARPDPPSVRQSLGRSLISVGQWLAADNGSRPAVQR